MGSFEIVTVSYFFFSRQYTLVSSNLGWFIISVRTAPHVSTYLLHTLRILTLNYSTLIFESRDAIHVAVLADHELKLGKNII